MCEKPRNGSDDDVVDHFIKTLRALAKLRVLRSVYKKDGTGPLEDPSSRFVSFPGIKRQPEVVCIVSSTGGPLALEMIIKGLPADFPVPVVILQHIDQEFVGDMVGWLAGTTSLVIKQAEPGERPIPGHVYVAPIGYHLRFSFDGRFFLDPDTQGYIHVPSGDILLESVATVYGPNAIGVILTGMGGDGAAGLLKMRQQGAHTVVQNEATSVVFGMPKEAIALGAAEFVEPIHNIADMLISLARKRHSHDR